MLIVCGAVGGPNTSTPTITREKILRSFGAESEPDDRIARRQTHYAGLFISLCMLTAQSSA